MGPPPFGGSPKTSVPTNVASVADNTHLDEGIAFDAVLADDTGHFAVLVEVEGAGGTFVVAVSYTHLTLPTTSRV